MAQDSPRRKPDLTGFRFGAGRLSLDFLGTVGHRPADHVERLHDTRRLALWLRAAGLPARRVRIGDSDLSHALSIREALHAVIDASLDDQSAPRTPLADKTAALLNAAAAVPTPAAVLTIHTTRGRAARPHVDWEQPATLAPLLAVIVRDGLELVDGPHTGQLRRCAAGDCRKIFLDTAPRPRRWCSRQDCGTRARVAAHRERQREQR